MSRLVRVAIGLIVVGGVGPSDELCPAEVGEGFLFFQRGVGVKDEVALRPNGYAGIVAEGDGKRRALGGLVYGGVVTELEWADEGLPIQGGAVGLFQHASKVCGH
jgi:hypothetical protein